MEGQQNSIWCSLNKILCLVRGHRYRVSRKVTAHVREYRCNCCGEEVTDTPSGDLAKLTPQFKETNSFLAEIYHRRASRMLPKVS